MREVIGEGGMCPATSEDRKERNNIPMGKRYKGTMKTFVGQRGN